MKVLVTGAGGFLGRNLLAGLETLPLSRRPQVLSCHRDTPPDLLSRWCREAEFVFHLAGVNRAPNSEAFWEGNFDFTKVLLARLAERPCPVLFASSVQAGSPTPYGQSKLAAEEVLLRYSAETGAEVFLYRLPHIFGKWSRPDYNSAVATFCHRTARKLPVTIQNPGQLLHLAYVDDVVEELLRCLAGSPNRQGKFCRVSEVFPITLGEILALLAAFARSRAEGTLPLLDSPFAGKLYATYLSFLPQEELLRPHVMHVDLRGSFTELFRTPDRGQLSVSITRPGIVRGNHWHQTKAEKFWVIQGEGMIRLRSPGGDILSFPVSGSCITAVDIPPGYAHTIENRGSADLVTILWASACFDPDHPDTYPQEL